ncbi:hypothetical protein C8F04DRAFT_1146895 [Mycena alexandri]|uniref:Uncharacterized protein n=1 Tax=Mycena alexandri TaxID=1745969 RepID=A0AAD6S3A7_9AGAR|nr:hypothetical protein C8F04DRAFT_1146895 [Mycena alexandri]
MRVLFITSVSCASALLLPVATAAPVTHEKNETPRGGTGSDLFIKSGLIGGDSKETPVTEESTGEFMIRRYSSEATYERTSAPSGCTIA